MATERQIESDELDAIAVRWNRKGTEMKQADLENWFTYHAPTPEQVTTYADIRSKAKELAVLFDSSVPDCADKTAAMRDLRNTVMQMNLAIACYVAPDSPVPTTIL